MANGTGVKDRRIVPDYAQDIKEILGIVQDIKIQNATRDAIITSVVKQSQKNHDSIEGNGKPGIKADMERVLGFVKAVSWGLGIVGGAVLIDLVTRVLALP